MNKAWLAPFSLIYGAGIMVRHKLFDWKILHSEEYDIPVVCVGNITVGGTGKTPMTEMLARHFKHDYNIAILSRGYKRRTKGFVEVRVKSSFLDVGDEAKMLKQRHPDIVVAVCEKRTEGIKEIRRRHPEINLIILDDGFQHRYVEPWLNIVLIDYTRPVYNDHMLPWGNLRDSVTQLHRANYIIMTKCPPDISPLDKRIVRKWLKLYPYQSLFFTNMESQPGRPLFPEGAGAEPHENGIVIAMSGIGNPTAFHKSLELRYVVHDTIVFPDHHPYRRRDLVLMTKALENAPEGTVIIMTEKDAVKLTGSKKIPSELKSRLFYQPQEIIFHDNTEKQFLDKLDNDVRSNPKYSLLNP